MIPLKSESKSAHELLGTFNPRHILQATGHAGSPQIPTDIKGIHDFKGRRLVHSAHFSAPEADGKGKKAVIVGACNSAQDIAQDYYEHGYDVTIVQRSSTLVIASKTIVDVLLSGLYNEGGVSYFLIPVQHFERGLTQRFCSYLSKRPI